MERPLATVRFHPSVFCWFQADMFKERLRIMVLVLAQRTVKILARLQLRMSPFATQ
jgi:hypothetical protein